MLLTLNNFINIKCTIVLNTLLISILNELLVHVLDMCFFLLSCHASSSRKKLTDKTTGPQKKQIELTLSYINIHGNARRRSSLYRKVIIGNENAFAIARVNETKPIAPCMKIS